MKSRFILVIIWVLFFLTRIYIYKFPPPYYSDVFHDYRRYAEMWSSGITPYFKHLYEYPPATLPLLYFPQFLNLNHLGHYYENYRLQILFFDLALFWLILKKINQLKNNSINKYLAVGFYILGTAIAKDFLYEGLDLIFFGFIAIALIYWRRRIWFWILFWLSVSLKLLTAPLVVPYFFLAKKPFFQEVKAAIIGFLIVWGLPLIIFRSSLLVMFFFHGVRGLKYASFPGFVVETINYFTRTETRLNQPPDFQLQGPISDIITKITAIVFPVSIILVLGYGLYKIIKTKQLDYYTFGLKITLIYIFTIFLTGKIFSQPFHIWFIPLIALFPFKSIKKQLVFILLGIWLLIIDTTPWLKFNESLMIINPLPLKFFIYSLRFLPMFILLTMSYKLPEK